MLQASKVIHTLLIAYIDPADYQAVLYSGGSGPMCVIPPKINRISSAIYESKDIVSAVCHGNAALISTTLSDGSLLIKEKRISGFTNEEDKSLGITEIVPFFDKIS